MSNKPHGKILTDKAIRELAIKDKPYLKVCGEPKELYIRVNPNGKKSFFIWYTENGNKKRYLLKEYRENIYSVAEARKEAIKILNKLESGLTIKELKIKNIDYSFEKYFLKFIESKKALERSEKTINRIINRHKLWSLPSLAKISVKEFEKDSSPIKRITDVINEQKKMSVLNKLIIEFKGIFDIAITERVINYNPAYNLQKNYLTPLAYARKIGKTGHYAALVDKKEIKEFIIDLKNFIPKTTPSTKNAVYLQILCANRPINTAGAKWADIDLENGIWTIPGAQMKTDIPEHIIALSSYAIKILENQKLYSGNFEYVFPSINKRNEFHHITPDAIRKAIVNLGYKNKYKGKVTTHGFRATFDTICELESAELLNMGLPYQAPEVALSHQEKNAVKNAYVRKRAEIEHLKTLMQWYGDYLNAIEPLF